MTKIHDWKPLFYSEILKRGRNYYYQGAVKDFHYHDGVLLARVGTGYYYDVKIVLDKNDRVLSMRCDCPYAENGRYCKHEAALLYYFENEETEKEVLAKKSSRIYPFRLADNSQKFFYDLDALSRDYQILEDRYQEAVSLIDQGKITVKDIGTGYLERVSSQILYAEVECQQGKKKSGAYAYLSPDEIVRIECDNDACERENRNPYYWYRPSYRKADEKLCVHEIAVLLFLWDFIRKYDPGDVTDRDTMQFLDRFSAGSVVNQDTQDEKSVDNVQFVPRLTKDLDGLLKLGFRVGNEKLYLVKNLSDLVEKYKSRGVYELSSKGRLDFSKFDFDEASKPYYDFVERIITDEKSRGEIREKDYSVYSRDSRYFTNVRDLVLFGQRLDDFYDLSKDIEVEFNDKSVSDGKKLISMGESAPRSSISISEYQKKGSFMGIRVEGSLPDLYMGSSYGYFLKGDCLYRTDSASMDMIRKMQDSFPEKHFSMTIGKKQIGRFYHHVLPELSRQFEVFENNKELYERYIPPKPSFDFYFDVSNGEILCKAKVSYAEKEFDLLDGNYDEMRDSYSERMAGELLRPYFKDRNENLEFTTSGDDDLIFEILENLVPQLMKMGDVHSTPAFDRLKVKKRTSLSVGVRIDNGLLELDIKSEDIPMEELAAIVSSYRLKKKYHKLKSGDLVRTDDENLEVLDELLSSLNISLKDFVAGKMDIPAYRALYLDKILEENASLYEHRDARFRNLVKDFKTIKESDYQVPASLEGVMRSYQKNGYQWLKTLSHFSFGGILADEMGLGKTIQVLALLLDRKQGEGGTSLVVCPSSLVYNWLSEVRRFTPELNACAVAGTREERRRILEDYEKYDLLVTSYDLLRRDADIYEPVTFAFEILDEAQYIKTYSTINAKACKAIKAKGHFALTGTPIENNLSELWSIFDFLMPGFLYSYEAFRNRFEAKIARDNDEKSMKQLKSMIAPFILRRKKADVLSDLPEKLEECIKVQFEEKQRRLYDSQVLKVSRVIENETGNFEQNKIAILAELMKLRQVCCEPSLVYQDFDGESAKRLACIELIRSAIGEGHKILLFSQFTSMLEIIEEELKKNGIAYYKITGQTKKEERLSLVEAFNEGDVPLFLISLKAGGTGLNLTGADIVIHYDPWWNVAAQNQATDRAHRIGQKKVVSVYKIIAADTIEEKIVDMQERKKALAENILDNQSVSLASLSKEELMNLLQ